MHPAGPIIGTIEQDSISPEWLARHFQNQINEINDDIAEIAAMTLTGDVTGGPPVAGVITTTIGALKVLEGMLADNAVSTIKIQNLAVTNGKIASGAINNAKVSAIAAISLSKLAFMTDGTVVGTPVGLGGSVPQALSGTDLINIIEAITGPLITASDLGANVLTFLNTPTSANFFGAITDETGSGKVVASIAPALTGPVTITNTNTGGSDVGLTVQGATENPPPLRVLLVPPAGGTSGGQILTMVQPLLADGNSIFFALGKAWSSTNAGFVAFTRNATDANTNMSIGHWGKNDIFKVYKSGGCVVGSSSVDPGDNNLSVLGVYKRNNVQVVGARDTGWAAWTSLGNKTTKASNTATLIDCAQTIKSILDAMIAHGLIGA